ncbi:MAG: gliding motility-associated C-terminal domain-containing protein [Saprospiraceae bacterium]
MNPGFTLTATWLYTTRLLTITLWSVLFTGIFSGPLAAENSATLETGVLPKGEENCESEFVDDYSPPDYFINPAEGKRVDLYYRGLKLLLPARVDIPNPETVEKVYVEVVYKGKLPRTSLHSAIQATIQNGTDVNLTPKLVSGSWGSNGVGIFYGEVGKTDRVQLNFEVEEASAQSVMLYVLRNKQTPGIYQAGTYANFYGYHTTAEFDIPLPPDPRWKNIRVTIPVTEITTDGRVLDFEITAGDIVKKFRKVWSPGFNFDNQCCIDSVETVLEGVTTAENVNVKVISPTSGGQSFVVSGIIQAELCPVCDPLVIDIPEETCKNEMILIECASPGAGYTAEWDFGPGSSPRTHTGFGEVYVEFANPTDNQEIKVSFSSATCSRNETHYIKVNECKVSTCALEAATVIQHPANGNSNGIIEMDMCVTCGSTPPYRIFYTFQGKQFEKGPFNEPKPRLINLEAGIYSKIYVIDSNGCRTNITGPVTLCNGGCGQRPTCLEQVCTLSGFNDGGEYRSLWIQGLGISSFKWKWVGGTGDLIVTGPNSVKIEGRVQSLSDASCGFDVKLVFKDRRNWNEWSALGRDWKGNRGLIVDDQHKTWDYYEMVAGESKLTGYGCWTGTLSLSPNPPDLTYGLQIGEGANDQNLNPGLSSWFLYDGTLNGTHYVGRGDINDEGTCRISDLERNAVPIISCGADFAVSCGGSPDDAPRPEINCGNPDDYTLTYEDREVSTNPRRIERTWTAAGPGGPATCTQTLTFADEAPPIFTQVPTQDRMLCGEVVPQEAEASDACGSVDVTFRETKFNETCPGNYDLRRVWTATDESGNTATAELIVHVIDEKGPKFISKVPSIVIDCSDDLPTDQPVAIDECGGNVDIDYSISDCEAQDPVYTWDGGTLTYLTEGEDPCDPYPTSAKRLLVEAVCSDNPNVRRRWRVVNRNDFPMWLNRVEAYGRDIYNDGFSVPAKGDIFFFTPTESGDKSITITWSDENHSPITEIGMSNEDQCELTKGETCACAYSRKWKATDECGNSSWSIQLVWKRDTDAPVLRNLPADRTYSAGTAIPAPANVTATDVCGTATVVFNEERIESADYNCDEAAVHYLFGWESVQNPLLTLNGRQFIIGSEPLRIQENCGGAAVVTGSLIDVANPNAVFELVWNLKDRRTFAEHSSAGGNAPTDCSTADKNGWSFYQLETNSRLTGTGANAGVSLTVSSPSNQWIQLGAGANRNNCKLGIYGELTYNTTSGNYAGNEGALRGALSSVELQEAGSCGDNYTLIRSWMATDDCGNRAFERQVIRVLDEETPTFEGVPNNITIDCSDPVPAANVTAIDNSDDDVEVTLDETDTGDQCGRTIKRTWTAIDDCGNSKTARQVITVRDQSSPVITFSNPAIQALNSGDILVISCSDVPTIDESIASVTDNCDPNPTLTFRDEGLGQGDCSTDGYRERFRCTWTATDQCGNETVFFLFVEFHDDKAPVLAQVPANKTQACDAALPTDQPTASDNCSDSPTIVETQSTITGSCADSYQVVRLWTATDDCGNTATASQVVTLNDESAPVFSGVPAAVTLNCEDALPTAEPTANDNCDQNVRLVETQETQQGACGDTYVMVRLWTATDNCGNIATASQVVTVQDNQAPTLTFSNARLNGMNDGGELIVDCDDIPFFNEGDVVANDNCDNNVNVTFTDNLVSAGDCATDGFVKHFKCTWTAVDACGNTESISINLKIKDNTIPAITSVPGNISISCEQSLPTSQPTISDNCTSDANLTVAETSTTVPGSCSEDYRVIRLWTVTDACGNEATASQVVTVKDEIRPILAQVPESLTVSCDDPFPTTLPTATDNCDTDVAVTVSENRTSDDCPGNSSVVRVFTATDNCGNTATASQVVTIRDREEPTLSQVPADATLSCTDAIPTTQPVASDNCDTDVAVTETSERRDGACPDSYKLVRLWTATDHCGNETTASQVLTIQDTEVPVLASLPQNTTIRCDEQLPTNRPTASDNCDNDVNIAETQETRAGRCANSYEVVRLFTATDNCGNVATGSQIVTVTDDIKPEFSSVPANITIDCNGTVPQEQPSATDNCDGQVAVTETQENRPGLCAGSYTIVRLFTAIDKCGNESTASQIVTVQDIEAPVFAYVPANLAISCAESLPTEEAQASDNCDQAVVITERQETRAGNCAGTYDVVRFFTATDHCGNTVSASQVVSVFDDEAPTFAGVPTNVSISCEEQVPTSAPTASDNCDANVDVQLTETREDGTCADNYRVIRRWVATDHCGNAATASQVVTVQDQTNPTFAGVPQNMTIACSQSLPTTQPTATDNCDTDVTVVETQRTEAGACTDSYKVIRVWTATDNCGNVETASQTVQVEDKEAPSFANVPSSVSISCDEPLPSIGPDVTDNCDDDVSLNETQETIPGACPETYKVVRTWTATDNCGNVETASQTVTVTDSEAPTFAFVPATITIDCDASLPASQPEVDDNCDQSVQITETQETQAGRCAGAYTVIRLWTAVDNCGNTSTANQTVNVQDISAPTFASVPQATTVQCDAALPVTQPIVTDNCDDDVTVTEAQTNEAGRCAGNYTVVRTWTAVDDCGNTATAVQRVTVEDTEAPIFTQVPTSVTLSCEESVPTVLATATDNCDTNVSITETQDRVEGNCPGNFTVTRLFTATDHCGNVTTASQVVNFQDNTNPTFASVPATVTIECDGTLPTNAPTASDNCDQNVSIGETQETQPGPCTDSYRVIRLWTATDNCGNASTASQIVIVEDTQAPIFANVPAEVTVECSDPLPTDMATATDNCDTDVTVTVAERNETGNCTDSYTVVRVFTAVDNCGNSTTAEQRVNVVDTQAPTFASVPQAVTISCDEAVPTTAATATDNCDTQVSVTETERTVAGDCADRYEVIRLFTATDNCGNTATAEQVITIQDTQAPTFASIPQALTIRCDEALPTTAPIASDNCDTQVSVTEAQRNEPGNCAESYTVIRTWTAVDNCGNTATAEQRITLTDEVAPVLVSVPVGVTIACDQPIPTDMPVATDNCDDDVSITEAQETVPGDCPGAYDVIRTFTATDGCGNTATASQTIKVIDERNPVFAGVPTAVTISCDEELPSDQPTATDTCDENVDIEESEEFLAGNCGGSYRVIRQWTATDDCGNTATATQLVTVQDLTNPIFASVPAAVNLSCDDVLPTDLPTATDNCDDDVHISETQQRMPGGCADSYTLVRTFTATDECGNITTASQIVTVADNANPEFASVPSDVEISCDEAIPTDQPTATDLCDDDVAITEAQETIPGACPGAYQIIRTWTAVDNCGNTAIASQTVSVGDRAEPTFTNVPAAVTISCDGEVPTEQPVAIDNCDDNVNITEAQTTETGDCTDSYKVVRTWTATDDCGNVAMASQVVTVEDSTSPEFVSVPPAVSISCDQELPTTQPRANDNCDTEVDITERTDRDRGNCGSSYTVTRIWTATDNCGNTATATQLVTVEDNTPPVFANVPASVTILCDESAPDNEPTATDNCDDEVRIRSNEERIDGGCADSYQLVRTWTAEDDCGNIATASQVVTVIDPTAPTFAQIPPETTITCSEGLPTSQPVTNDNCDSDVTITETQETLPGACPDSYVVIRTWIITDNCGNSDRATQKVTVVDTSEPTFASVPSSRTVNCDEDPGDEEPVASDNCDDDVAITMTETTNGDNCAEGIELIRIWTATDNCGNTATASQTITFVDNEDPVLAGVERSITVECDQPIPLIYPTATDNCDREVDIMYFDNEQDEECGKTITRTWVASDDCGNTSSETQLIIIRDTQLPVLSGVPTSAQINCDDAIPTATVTATDNCTQVVDIVLEEFEIPGGCPGERSIIRIWTATDDCGNAAVGSQTITITDGGAPVFAGIPTAVTITCADDLPSTLPTATDNCGGGSTAVAITVEETNEPGNCANNYRVIRVFTATDDCGNTSTASQTVTVSDDEAPTFASVPADASISCSEQLPQGTATATDNCDNSVNVSMTERTVAGNCDDNYEVIRTYSAVDACGNLATATQTITISDTEAPTFANVPANVEVSCDDPIPTDTPTATDDCDNDVEISVVEDRIAGTSSNEYQIVRTWTAVDNCGNTATASQTISVIADGEPTFTFVPENLTLSCTQQIPNADARATDNCDGDLQVVLAEERVDGSCANNYDIVRTWTATDTDSNSATASQTITVSDLVPPSFDQVPADVSLVCGQITPTDMATASDICDQAVVVTVTETNRPGTCGSEYDVLRTFRATDACGNAATATQVVSFIDDQAPEFTFVPDSEEFQCSVGQPRERAQATDNCTSNVQITFEDVSPSSDCSQRLQRVWTATDECGNTATAVQQILLEDTEDPELINVPANSSVDLTNGGTIPAPANVTANDNCDSNPNVSFNETSQPTSGCGYVLVRTWEATDQCGNTEKATQRITVTEDAGVSITVDPTSDCAPTGVQVHAVPATQGATYTWTSNSGSFTNGNTANPTFVPSGAGTYTINLTVSGSGCTGKASETITIDGATLNVTGNGPICVGGTIQLTASAGADSYAWSGPNGFSASQANVTLNDATVAMGGVYTLTADFGSCTQEATVTVAVSGSLQVTLDIPTLICSEQMVTFTAGGADNATWTAPSGQTYTGATTQVGPISFGSHNGQWSVVATNAAGCSSTLDFTVQVIRSPQLSATSNSPVCAGGQIQLNAVGAQNYQWTGPNGYTASSAAPVITDLSAYPVGSYQFIAVGTNLAGCEARDTATVVVTGAAVVNASVPATICEGEVLNFTASGADSYVWSGPNGFSSLGASPSIQAITAAGSGTYTLNAETAAGCSITETFEVVVRTDCNPNECNLPTQSDFTLIQPDCGQSNGSITFNGDTTGYSFVWTPGQNTGLAAGDYWVTVTKRGDPACAKTYDFTLVEDNAPSATVDVEGEQCDLDGIVTITPTPAGTYTVQWSDQSASSTSLVRDDLKAGAYTFVLTADNGCTLTQNVTVPDDCDCTTVTASVPTSICEGETLNFVASGAVTYVWQGPNRFSNTSASPNIQSITAAGAGTYTLNAITVEGCAITETFEVVVRTDCNPGGCNLPVQNDFTLVQPDCGQSNGSITFGGDTTGYAFVWTGGQSSGLAAGSYELTVTKRGDAACAKTYDFTLVEDGAPSATVDVEGMQCSKDGIVTITPVPAGTYTVQWSDQSTSSTSLVRSDLAAGDYTFVLTDNNGCTLTENVNVPNDCECEARISVLRARETDVCLVDNEAAIGIVLVTQPVIPTNYARSYLLADVNSSEVLRTNKTGEFVVSGTTTYSIHQLVYDSINVANTLVGPGKTVQEIEALFIQGGGVLCGALTTFGARITTAQCCIIPEVISTSTTDAGCGQQNGTANVQVAGTVGDYAYVWSPNLGTPLSPSGNVRGGLPVGTYQVRIENRADANCFAETTLNVGASDIAAGLPTITPATCGDDNGTVVFANAAAGLTFTWNDNVTSSSRNDLEAGTYAVLVTNGQPNCTETITLTVGAIADFGLTAAINATPRCGEDDGSVTISANGGSGNFSYDWGSGATRTDLAGGLYTVRVTDQTTSCIDSITFTLTEEAVGQVRITIADVELRCNGAADGSPVFTLDYDTDFRFPPRISFVDSQGEVVTFGELGPGSYCMQIRDADDCLAGTGCFEVTQPAGLVVNVTAIAAGCDDDGSITLDIIGGTAPYSFDWAHLPAANDPRDLTNLNQGQYTVFITDANGCASTVNNINIGRNCGCSPTLPVLTPFSGDVCLTDAQVLLGTQVVSTNTDPGVQSAYLLVDSDGIVLEVGSSPEFWVTAVGNYSIHGIVYNPLTYNLSAITVGSSSINSLNTQFIQGGGFLCVGLDLDGTPIVVDDCSGCTAEVGVLSTTDPVIWCADDGLPSVVSFDVTASTGTITYALVDADGIVINISTVNEINFEGRAAGTYTVYAVATEGATNLPVPGTPLLPANGCIDLSQGIEITALTGTDCNNACQVAAGSIANAMPTTLCADNLPSGVVINATGQTGSQRAYVMTDMNGSILSVQTVDGSLEVAAVTTGQYRVYVLVYEDPITGLENGRSINNLGGCFELTSPTVITVASGTACGQSPMPDTVNATIPVSTIDTICFVLDPGFNPATTTYMLVGGNGSTSQSAFGEWTLLPNGCIIYETGNIPGINVDSIFVIATDGGQTDVTMFIISVTNAVNTVENVNINVDVNSTESACPNNIPASFTNVNATLASGGTTGSSSFGSYFIDANTGCLTYTANTTSGAFIDTVVVFVCDDNLLDCHEVSYIITVLPEGQTIVRDVNQGDTLVLCPLSNLLFGTAQTPTLCTQPSQGTVMFDATTGCFIYTAPANYVGPDEVCIEVCDDQGVCVQLIVQINVLAPCGDLVQDSSVGLDIADCDALADYCLPIANANIGDFTLVLDGQPYRNTSVACNNGLGTIINLDTGAHVLAIRENATGCTDTVNISVGCADCGFNRTPAVIDLTDCNGTGLIELSLLQGNWNLYQFTLDGVDASNDLIAAGTTTQLSVDTGVHQLIIRALDNSCQEVIDMVVRCDTNGGNPTGDTLIVRTIRLSFSDTICLGDLNLALTGAVTTLTDLCPGAGDGGEASIVFDAVTQCFVYTGLLPGTDTLCLQACTATGCDTFGLVVNVIPPSPSMENGLVLVGGSDFFCIDTTELASPITEVFNFCAASSGTIVEFDIDEDTYCVTYTGLAEGMEQGCFVICNAIACDTVFLNITVGAGNSDLPPVAVDDRDMTTKGTSIEINILTNDTLNGPLVQLYPLTLPLNGNLFIVGDSIIRYTPNPEFCGGVDSFQYVINNGIGFDTATVRIDVACDDLIIFSGFSPNGDGVNDAFKILGIEDFPENKVMIFNRWGNEVFNVENYDNSEGKSFKGRWGNKTLPDGTYFYVIDLGGENGCRSGYLQITR